MRGASYLLLVLCLVTRPGLIFLAPALAVAVWIHNRWQTVANVVFLALTGDTFTAFGEAALTYQFPSQRRGRLWNLGESTVATSLSVVGLGTILIAGLPMLEESDTLITPIPGLYVQHSHLPYWVLGVVFFAVGALLTVAGTAVDRRVKRRSMRRETALPIRRGAKSPVIFLRPFGTEELLVPAHQGPRRDGIAQILPRREEFLEDIVTWMLWTRGDVLAIAKPGAGAERTVGAAHHVLRDETDWKAAVAKLLEGAAQVVLVPGTTPGVSWELERVRASNNLARKTLLVNPEPKSSGERFLGAAGAPPALAEQLHGRGLLVLGAVPVPGEPRLLCSTLAEDLDYEVAVEWALRNGLRASGRRWARLLGWLS